MKYVVSLIEYGDGSDGRPRVLGIYDTKYAAEMAIEQDMYTYGESLGMYCSGDWCVWRSPYDEWEQGCAWNISEIEL